ncbi:dnaD and phage-associated domain protein [Streptococcus canis]|uniref:replication initiator protein A n=1 Tax=Streptococcus canis TaxID=1329 RepID=UPI0010E7BB37|nr:replication initiator protein A [Streptococcus canis]GFE45979.1 hypothetical protein ScFU6_17480 [Streptococcus canis]VTS75427.1 dnaD and phage-associated domain protein [Streptococcus canis]
MHIDEVRNNKFYQFPQWLLEEPYSNLSYRAMLMYMLLFDRRGLSEENQWFDDNGKIFMYFTNEQFMKALKCSEPSVLKSKKELHQAGLLDEVQQGVNKPNRLYINGTKNFLGQELKTFKHGTKNFLGQDLKSFKGINTNNINTNISINNKEYNEQSNLGKISQMVFENWGKQLTPLEIETVNHMLKDYPFEIIEFGIREATLRNRKTIRWVDTSCKDWYVNHNLETITAIEDYLHPPKWDKPRPNKTKSNVPSWSNPNYQDPTYDDLKVNPSEVSDGSGDF